MPDWLRSWLIYEMPRQREREVRQVLEIFLAFEPNKQGLVGEFQIEISRQYRQEISLLAQSYLRFQSKQSSAENPLRDYIFQEFMASRKPLSVRIPKELRQQLLKRRSKEVKWGVGLKWLVTTIFVLAGGEQGYIACLMRDRVTNPR